MVELHIAGRRIADNAPAYCIAEVGHNHGGSVERCKELFKAARECGVDAVKLQKRDNKRLFTKGMYESPYVGENSYGRTYGEHREALEFDYEQYKELQAYCNEIGVVMFATPFDFESVDFLERVGIPCYKIASGDLMNTPLQRYIAKTGKPVMLSTGGGTYEDVQRAHDTIMAVNKQLVIMQCTAAYPAEPKDINLPVIARYKEMFPDAVIGFSDHFIGKVFGPAAYVMGARVFEKHFTIHRWWKGTDQAFSLEPDDMRKYVRDIGNISVGMSDQKMPLDCEIKPLYKMGKKIVASRQMSVGEVLTASDVRIVSPNDGIPPCELDKLLGKKLICDLDEEDNIRWESCE